MLLIGVISEGKSFLGGWGRGRKLEKQGESIIEMSNGGDLIPLTHDIHPCLTHHDHIIL